MLSSFLSRDSQTKKIQDNITKVEKHFGELCQLFAAYSRKTARLRDKGDLLVKQIELHADTETPDLKRGMKEFADHLAKIQDYRHAQVHNTESFTPGFVFNNYSYGLNPSICFFF